MEVYLKRLNFYYYSFYIFFILIAFINESLANVYFRPKTKEELDRISKHPSTSDRMVRIKEATVTYLNRVALARDFPFLEGKSDDVIKQWILDRCAYVSETQLKLVNIRNSAFNTVPGDTLDGNRPEKWFRAAVVPVSTLNDKSEHAGLIDIKGTGLPATSPLADDQVKEFNDLQANHDEKGLNALRTRGHSNGLATEGEALAEVVRQNALQDAFNRYNAAHGTDFQTVENYFVISLGFDVLMDDGKTERAALIGRQAHIGRDSLGQLIPHELYVDFEGYKQSDSFGAAIDFGGVFVTDPKYLHHHLTENQVEEFRNYLSEKPKVYPASDRWENHYKKIFNAQSSRAWKYAHETAKAIKDHPNEEIVKTHIQQMAGENSSTVQESHLERRLKEMLTSSNKYMRRSGAEGLAFLDRSHGKDTGPNAKDLFQMALQDHDFGVRGAAARSLKHYAGENPYEVFKIALKDKGHPAIHGTPMGTIHGTAIASLYRYQGTHLEELFQALLKDPEFSKSAKNVFSQFKGKNAFELFQTVFKDEDPSLRAAAIEGLGQYGDRKETADLFKVAFQDKEPEVRATAASALERYQGEHLYDLLNLALKDPEEKVRITAAFSCFNYHGPGDGQLLRLALNDPSPLVRERGADALEGFKGDEVFELFEKALKDEDQKVVNTAGEALLNYPRKNKITLLHKLLQSDSLNSRKAAAEGLKAYVRSNPSELAAIHSIVKEALEKQLSKDPDDEIISDLLKLAHDSSPKSENCEEKLKNDPSSQTEQLAFLIKALSKIAEE